MDNVLKKKSSKHENNFPKDLNHGITSFKAILNQEVCFEDDNNEQYLNNLTIGDLNTKVNKYNSLYLENVRSYLIEYFVIQIDSRPFCLENQCT